MADSRLTARHKAMNLLARREHTRKELINKLLARDYEESDALAAIDQLTQEGLQSDDRFAEAFVAMRSKAGHGPVRIQKELQERGVSSEIQDRYLDPRDDHWRELIRIVREKKFGVERPDDYQNSSKQARFLQYRGFTNEQIRNELKNID